MKDFASRISGSRRLAQKGTVRVKGKFSTLWHLPLTRFSQVESTENFFFERGKTDCGGAHRPTCFAAAQVAVAAEAKRVVREVPEAGGSGIRLLYWAHGGSPSNGPPLLRA